MDLEDVLFKGQKRRVSIKLEGVRQFTRDGQPIDCVQMEAEDGDFKAHTRHTRSYAFTCDQLVVDVH